MMKRDNIRGAIGTIGLGIATIGLGCKGFTREGLPWSKRRNITGKPAEIVGVACMVIGAAFVCFGLFMLSED
jgi:hypothetical protein